MARLETLEALHLAADGRELGRTRCQGGRDSLTLSLRRIVADALALDGVGIVLIHNHPSGDPTPSRADVSATETLRRALGPIGIRLHDHIIHANHGVASFRALGLL